MNRRTALFLAVFLTASADAGAEEVRLLRYPNVSQNQVTFVCAGDVYVAPRVGGQAVKLTTHKGLELFPRFSPDGSQIAFTGQYDGDFAVYVIPSSGGEPRRLTYHPGIARTSERMGPENVVMGWHPDGNHVLFRSRKEANDVWDGRAYLVGLTGGLPEPLPMATAGFTSFSPDLSKVAYCPLYRDFRTWKRYEGGLAQDVWIFDLSSFEARKITDWVGTDNLPMWYQDRIYFNSDRTGTLNLYCYELASETVRPVTGFTEWDVRWPSLGDEGIAFENAGYIYVLNLPSEQMHKLEIHVAGDHLFTRPRYVAVSEMIRGFDLSPDGDQAAFSARGEIFTLPAEVGNTENLTGELSGSNEIYPRWSPDGKWIAFLSDRTGEDEFFIVSSDGDQTLQITNDGHCFRFGALWSPDSRKLAFSDIENGLYYIDVTSRQLVQIDYSPRSEIHRYDWSPDSRFLAYDKRLDNRIRSIFVYDVNADTIHQVTLGYTHDYAPAFDPDGKYLYFLSQRDFNPILSRYEFSFVNDAITNLFLIVLASDGASPFAPRTAVSGEQMPSDSAEGKSTTGQPKPTGIDFDRIARRQVAFELPAGNYSGLKAISGAVFYLSNPIRGLSGNITQDRRTLHKYDIADEDDHVFAEGISSYQLEANGKKMLIAKDGEYHLAATSDKEADLSKNKLDLSGLTARLDPKAEYGNIFEDVWRRQRDYFYDRNLHGVDWQRMHDKYAELLPYVEHRYDLTYLLGEMIGELACSHTYVGRGDLPKVESGKIGLLGVDFERDTVNDRIRIGRILSGENWDEDLRSPLLEPGVAVSEGDYLLAIDGHEITADTNPYSLTQNRLDRTLELTVNHRPTLRDARTIGVTPIASEEALRYFNWVQERLRYVDSASSGRIGYVHLPDMSSHGLERFAKMFYHQSRRPGLIIDVRFNGGGFVSGLVLERLRRKVVAMTGYRRFEPTRSPGNGMHCHMVTLINQCSCSDGDYFPYFFREYGLGPLVGVRTWGGVIGIRGIRPLVDGGYCTVPEYGIFNLEGEWVMENHGVEPDIVVENTPMRLAQGYDDQLDWAVRHILTRLEQEPKTLPGRPEPPAPR